MLFNSLIPNNLATKERLFISSEFLFFGYIAIQKNYDPPNISQTTNVRIAISPNHLQL